ncbi:MAG: hypothetical protein N2C14_14085, partial [Planctomycetales bacterium]
KLDLLRSIIQDTITLSSLSGSIMTQYKYVATDSEGAPQEGVVEAESDYEAANILTMRGLTVDSVAVDGVAAAEDQSLSSVLAKTDRTHKPKLEPSASRRYKTLLRYVKICKWLGRFSVIGSILSFLFFLGAANSNDPYAGAFFLSSVWLGVSAFLMFALSEAVQAFVDLVVNSWESKELLQEIRDESASRT